MKSLSLIAITLATCLASGLASCSSTNSKASASPEDMQAAMVAYSTPGPNHKLLDPMVGSFRTTVKHRMAPDQPWSESTGTCVNSWIYDGRFLQSKFRGEFEGQPFEGQGLMGYDNSSNEFVGFWTDSWSTGLAPISRGSADASGKVITQCREMKDPFTGVWTKTRDVTTIVGPNEHRMDSYSQPDGEDEFHMMTIEFKR